MRIRLRPNEAQHLNIDVKDFEGTKNPRYSISDDELRQIKEFRLGIIKTLADEENIPINDLDFAWVKTPKGSYKVNNPLYKSEEQETLLDRFKSIIDKNKRTYPTIVRTLSKDAHLLVINPADIHIGKLASAFETSDEYNVKIAVKRVHEGVQGIIDKSAGYNIDKIVFVGGNDILHTDNTKSSTTGLTPQNTDGMWYENFLTAFKLYVEVIEKLIALADVHFVFCPSNHDLMSGFFLCQNINQYFRNNENITFDSTMAHRKYYVYGTNLLGFTHANGAKQDSLPQLMAEESKDWSNSVHRYIYTHHLHHKVAKDIMSVCIEGMRSPSGADSWHHINGFQHAPKAVEGFMHHKDFGQIARFSHIF